MKKNTAFLIIMLIFALDATIQAQSNTSTNDDAIVIRQLFEKTLTEGKSYEWLRYLTKGIGNRLSGSASAQKAVDWAKNTLDTIGIDTVYLQPCMVPRWERGAKETAHFVKSKAQKNNALHILALGGSPAGEVTAEVIEVKSLDEVDKLGQAGIKGKIVFYNRPMDMAQIYTFNAYGGAVDQRGAGPARAAKYGAVGAIVRAMTTNLDDYPHTGMTVFGDGVKPIPAISVSTNDATLLSTTLKAEPNLKIYIKTNCQQYPDVQSYNVIAEWKGSEFPEEYISVGGHLDSWDVGEGAHDDGTGCVQSMEVLYMLKKAGYKPKRTLRCVLFMNEENGLIGGKAYADAAAKKKENHLFALESDGGGHTPRGFSFEAENDIFAPKYKKILEWADLLEPYSLILRKGGSGADISPLKKQKVMLGGLNADSQRYFDFHHTSKDTFEAVNERELKLGAAAMTSLIYLIDKYGL